MSELTLWTEPLAESNCYLLAEDGGCVVIDPNHPQGPLRVLEERGWSPELILLTHEHCDHTAGLEALRERYPTVRVLASAACSSGLASTRLNMSRMMEVYLTFHGKPGVTYPPFVCRPADLTYDQTYETNWRGHVLQCVSLPGHTPGSAGHPPPAWRQRGRLPGQNQALFGEPSFGAAYLPRTWRPLQAVREEGESHGSQHTDDIRPLFHTP